MNRRTFLSLTTLSVVSSLIMGNENKTPEIDHQWIKLTDKLPKIKQQIVIRDIWEEDTVCWYGRVDRIKDVEDFKVITVECSASMSQKKKIAYNKGELRLSFTNNEQGLYWRD